MQTRALVIRRITRDCPSAKIIRVADPTGRPFRLVAGQYGLLSFGPYEAREFTYINPPTSPQYLEFAIKRVGPFTKALHGLRVGQRINHQGPMGDALSFTVKTRKDLVFIAGGSGISPFISILRFIAAERLQHHVTLLYSSREEKNIILRKELQRLAKQNPRLRIIYTLTGKATSSWQGERGKVSRAMLRRHIIGMPGKTWFLCGPPPMVEALAKTLRQLKVPAAQIHRAEG